LKILSATAKRAVHVLDSSVLRRIFT